MDMNQQPHYNRTFIHFEVTELQVSKNQEHEHNYLPTAVTAHIVWGMINYFKAYAILAAGHSSRF